MHVLGEIYRNAVRGSKVRRGNFGRHIERRVVVVVVRTGSDVSGVVPYAMRPVGAALALDSLGPP